MATPKEKVTLRMQLQELLGCIRFIDGTLIDIWKPWQDEAHHTWFDGQNKFMQSITWSF